MNNFKGGGDVNVIATCVVAGFGNQQQHHWPKALATATKYVGSYFANQVRIALNNSVNFCLNRRQFRL
jgi:hypothetical protein